MACARYLLSFLQAGLQLQYSLGHVAAKFIRLRGHLFIGRMSAPEEQHDQCAQDQYIDTLLELGQLDDRPSSQRKNDEQPDPQSKVHGISEGHGPPVPQRICC